MNLKQFLIPVFAIGLGAFCSNVALGQSQKIISVDTSHVQTLRIDPSNSNGGMISDIFAEVEYIPLETTKESLFGSIGELVMSDDRYIITDSERKHVLVFDKKGKFIKKIGTENTYISQLVLNKWTKQFFVVTDQGKKTTYYDLDGKELKVLNTDFAFEKTKNGGGFHYLTKDKAYIEFYYIKADTTTKYYKNFTGSIVTWAGDDRVVKARGLGYANELVGLDLSWSGRCRFVTPGDVDSVYYMSKSYEYAIYAIGPNSIKLDYKFMFPLGNALPKGFAADTTLHGKRWEWFDKNQSTIQNVSNFYRTGNSLYFNAQRREDNEEDWLIYNLKTGSLIAYKHITQDASTNFLPIYERRTAYSSGGIITSYDHNLYTAMSSLEMFKNFEEHKDRNLKYPPHIEKYFTTGDRKDNAVIVRLKLKDEF